MKKIAFSFTKIDNHTTKRNHNSNLHIVEISDELFNKHSVMENLAAMALEIDPLLNMDKKLIKAIIDSPEGCIKASGKEYNLLNYKEVPFLCLEKPIPDLLKDEENDRIEQVLEKVCEDFYKDLFKIINKKLNLKLKSENFFPEEFIPTKQQERKNIIAEINFID